MVNSVDPDQAAPWFAVPQPTQNLGLISGKYLF